MFSISDAEVECGQGKWWVMMSLSSSSPWVVQMLNPREGTSSTASVSISCMPQPSIIRNITGVLCDLIMF